MLTAEQQAAKKKQHILKNAQEGRARAHALQKAKRQKVIIYCSLFFFFFFKTYFDNDIFLTYIYLFKTAIVSCFFPGFLLLAGVDLCLLLYH